MTRSRQDGFQQEFEIYPGLRRILKYIDFFLPRSRSEIDDDLRFKARFAVLDLLTGTVLLFLGIFMSGVPTYKSQAAFFFLEHVAFLVWLKFSRNTELVVTTFVCFSLAVSCTLIFGFNQSVLTPAPQYWFRLIIYSFILCQFRITAAVWLVIVIASLLLLPFGLHTGFKVAFPADFNKIVVQYAFRVVTLNLWAIASVAAFRILLRLTNQSVQKESEWLIRSSKVRQLAVLAENLLSLFEDSVKKVSQKMSRLQVESSSNDLDAERQTILEIEEAHKQILDVARSYSVMHKTRLDERLDSVTVQELSDHVRLLLSEYLRKFGWQLEIHNENPRFMMHSLSPKFLLLIVCICHQTLEEGSDHEIKVLYLTIEAEGKELIWKVSIQKPTDEKVLSRASSGSTFSAGKEGLSIIQELVLQCNVQMSSYGESDRQVTELRLKF